MMGMANGTAKRIIVTLENNYDRSPGIAAELLQAVPTFRAAMAYKLYDSGPSTFRDCVQLCGVNNDYNIISRYIGIDGDPYQAAANASSTVAYASAGDKYVIIYDE